MMDYKAVEKPPTPPATPEEGRSMDMDVDDGGGGVDGGLLNGHAHQVAPTDDSGLLDVHLSTHRASTSSASTLSIDSSSRRPSSTLNTPVAVPAYPVPSTLAEQLDLSSRAVTQRVRLLFGYASQTVVNVLPATPVASSFPSGRPPSPSTSSSSSNSGPFKFFRAPSRSTSPTKHIHPNGASSGSEGSSSRLLTGHRSGANGSANATTKPHDRNEANESPIPAWRELLHTLSTALPSISSGSSGPKRIRTRTRRYLIFLACVSLLCYIFSNTLREAYYSAAVERRQHVLDELERKRLGPHLSEFTKHPIDDLLANAKKEWDAKVARQSTTAEEAIAEYKRRYKRDPPEGFTEWFEYAKSVETVLVDEYDSLMASLEPFWALEAEEIRRRTFQIGLQPSFALVHVEAPQGGSDKGGTFWDANENEELIKYYGVERARGFERMVRPFIGRPGIVNMVFAINELAEPRVLVPWEEKQIIQQALAENSTVNIRQLQQIVPSKAKKFFPDPVWKGDGTTWEHYIRTCPPQSAVRKMLTSMSHKVVHLADVLHIAYNTSTDAKGHLHKRGMMIADTVRESGDVELQINPKPKSKRKRSSLKPSTSRSMDLPAAWDEKADGSLDAASRGASLAFNSIGMPTKDVYLNTRDFQFNANLTSLSHDQLCNDPRSHDTQGQFCSDFRSLDSLYPVFSPSTMPGFADVVIPSHYYAATGPKYHLEAHRKKVKKAVKDTKTGKWTQLLVLEDFPEWSARRNKVFWRGSTTGGGNNPAGRQLDYQRHRFVRMTSDASNEPVGIVLPAKNGTKELTYVELSSRSVNADVMDVAFTSLDGCGHEKVCDAVKNGGYRIGDKVPLIDVTKYKMLIDIDGMAYSARLMALFESGAAVLKSTIYAEYYSDQIQPWYHYIPISYLYSEIYNIYSYFLGSEAEVAIVDDAGTPLDAAQPKLGKSAIPGYRFHPHISAPDNQGAHEAELEKIGTQGQQWQEEFGKKRDMEVYCYRLALEWGRIWQKDGPVGTF